MNYLYAVLFSILAFCQSSAMESPQPENIYSAMSWEQLKKVSILELSKLQRAQYLDRFNDVDKSTLPESQLIDYNLRAAEINLLHNTGNMAANVVQVPAAKDLNLDRDLLERAMAKKNESASVSVSAPVSTRHSPVPVQTYTAYEIPTPEFDSKTISPGSSSSSSTSSLPGDLSDTDASRVTSDASRITNDFSEATQNQIAMQRACGLERLTPRSQHSFELRERFYANQKAGSADAVARSLLSKNDSESIGSSPESRVEKTSSQTVVNSTPVSSPVTSSIPSPTSSDVSVSVPRINADSPPAKDFAPEQNGRNTVTIALESAAITVAIWTTAEIVMAYKKISVEEWHEAKTPLNKMKLLACKTGSSMLSRPGQAVTLVRDALNRFIRARDK